MKKITHDSYRIETLVTSGRWRCICARNDSKVGHYMWEESHSENGIARRRWDAHNWFVARTSRVRPACASRLPLLSVHVAPLKQPLFQLSQERAVLVRPAVLYLAVSSSLLPRGLFRPSNLRYCHLKHSSLMLCLRWRSACSKSALRWRTCAILAGLQ